MGSGIPISVNKRHEIAAAVLNNPKKTYPTLAAELGVSVTTIDSVVKQFGIQRGRGSASSAHPRCGSRKAVTRG